jgi:hypothetical protein
MRMLQILTRTVILRKYDIYYSFASFHGSSHDELRRRTFYLLYNEYIRIFNSIEIGDLIRMKAKYQFILWHLLAHGII